MSPQEEGLRALQSKGDTKPRHVRRTLRHQRAYRQFRCTRAQAADVQDGAAQTQRSERLHASACGFNGLPNLFRSDQNERITPGVLRDKWSIR